MVRGAWSGGKAWALAGLLSLALYAVAAGLVTGPEGTLGWLVLYGAAWIPYAVAVERAPRPRPWVILAWALAARLVLATSSVWLSDDLYRYLLDGRLLLDGVNPFRWAPAAAAVAEREPVLAALVNHPAVPTIYPPLVQMAGALAALLHLGPVGWRILLSGVDLAAVVAVARLFGSWRAAAVYGLCPLAVWEAGANGHTEPLLALALVLALTASRARRAGWAGLFLAAASLVKLFPLLLLPLWWGRAGGRRTTLVATAVFVGAWAPFALGGVDPTVGLRTYLAHWSFNSPVFALLQGTVGQLLPVRWVPFAWLAGGALWWGRRGADPARALPFLLFGFLVLGPTLHPWYALWLLPLLGPRPHRGLWAFVGAMGLSYEVWWEVHRAGVWRLDPLLQGALWAVVVLGWIFAGKRGDSAVGSPRSLP